MFALSTLLVFSLNAAMPAAAPAKRGPARLGQRNAAGENVHAFEADETDPKKYDDILDAKTGKYSVKHFDPTTAFGHVTSANAFTAAGAPGQAQSKTIEVAKGDKASHTWAHEYKEMQLPGGASSIPLLDNDGNPNIAAWQKILPEAGVHLRYMLKAAAATGVPMEVLAALFRVETDYLRSPLVHQPTDANGKPLDLETTGQRNAKALGDFRPPKAGQPKEYHAIGALQDDRFANTAQAARLFHAGTALTTTWMMNARTLRANLDAMRNVGIGEPGLAGYLIGSWNAGVGGEEAAARAHADPDSRTFTHGYVKDALAEVARIRGREATFLTTPNHDSLQSGSEPRNAPGPTPLRLETAHAVASTTADVEKNTAWSRPVPQLKGRNHTEYSYLILRDPKNPDNFLMGKNNKPVVARMGEVVTWDDKGAGTFQGLMYSGGEKKPTEYMNLEDSLKSGTAAAAPAGLLIVGKPVRYHVPEVGTDYEKMAMQLKVPRSTPGAEFEVKDLPPDMQKLLPELMQEHDRGELLTHSGQQLINTVKAAFGKVNINTVRAMAAEILLDKAKLTKLKLGACSWSTGCILSEDEVRHAVNDFFENAKTPDNERYAMVTYRDSVTGKLVDPKTMKFVDDPEAAAPAAPAQSQTAPVAGSEPAAAAQTHVVDLGEPDISAPAADKPSSTLVDSVDEFAGWLTPTAKTQLKNSNGTLSANGVQNFLDQQAEVTPGAPAKVDPHITVKLTTALNQKGRLDALSAETQPAQAAASDAMKEKAKLVAPAADKSAEAAPAADSPAEHSDNTAGDDSANKDNGAAAANDDKTKSGTNSNGIPTKLERRAARELRKFNLTEPTYDQMDERGDRKTLAKRALLRQLSTKADSLARAGKYLRIREVAHSIETPNPVLKYAPFQWVVTEEPITSDPRVQARALASYRELEKAVGEARGQAPELALVLKENTEGHPLPTAEKWWKRTSWIRRNAVRITVDIDPKNGLPDIDRPRRVTKFDGKVAQVKQDAWIVDAVRSAMADSPVITALGTSGVLAGGTHAALNWKDPTAVLSFLETVRDLGSHLSQNPAVVGGLTTLAGNIIGRVSATSKAVAAKQLETIDNMILGSRDALSKGLSPTAWQVYRSYEVEARAANIQPYDYDVFAELFRDRWRLLENQDVKLKTVAPLAVATGGQNAPAPAPAPAAQDQAPDPQANN